jgi:hypothetical protein
VQAKLDFKAMPLQALLQLTSAPIAVEWAADAQAAGALPSAQVVQAAVAAHEKCNDKSCPFCSLDPGSVQQAVLAFKQALEAAMKGQGPLPLIEIAQDASTISAAAAAIAGGSSSNLLTAGGSSSGTAGGVAGSSAACGGSAKQKQAAAAAAAAAASNQQLFARGGWMEVFRGKLGKAAAKLAGPAAAAAVAGGGAGSSSGLAGDTQSLSRDLLEVLGVRGAAGLVGGAEWQQQLPGAGQGLLEGAIGQELQLSGLVSILASSCSSLLCQRTVLSVHVWLALGLVCCQ